MFSATQKSQQQQSASTFCCTVCNLGVPHPIALWRFGNSKIERILEHCSLKLLRRVVARHSSLVSIAILRKVFWVFLRVLWCKKAFHTYYTVLEMIVISIQTFWESRLPFLSFGSYFARANDSEVGHICSEITNVVSFGTFWGALIWFIRQ